MPVSIGSVDSRLFARQLTLYHEDYWDKVSPLDLIDTNRHADPNTPIGILIDNFNRITDWVKSIIVTEVNQLYFMFFLFCVAPSNRLRR
jgi:hypothetical protein